METAIKTNQTLSAQPGLSTVWAFDPSHTEIAFKVKHLMIVNVKGIFKQFDINVVTDGDDFTNAKIDFSMNICSTH